jgi:hypothetical protein
MEYLVKPQVRTYFKKLHIYLCINKSLRKILLIKKILH